VIYVVKEKKCMEALASGAKIGDQRTLSSLQRTVAMVAGQVLR
jgi:hypothetical protein